MFVTTTLSHIHCPSCGGLYAIAKEYLEEALRLGQFKKCWTCPYCKTERGYGQAASAKEIEQLKAQLESVQASATFHKERSEFHQREADHFRKSRDGVKGNFQKLKRRITNGVCPCCKRHFSALQEHIKSKHPEYSHE